jgi:anti-sigma factor RsiW
MTIETSTFPMMDCAEFERSVDAFVDDEFEPRERAEAEVHLAACARCQGLATAQVTLRTALRAALREAIGPATRAGRAPEALRQRISSALERERRPLWRRLFAPIPLAAAAATAAAVLVVVVAGHGPSGQLVEEAVRKYHRDLPLEVTTASVAPEAIPGWFAGKLDFKPKAPRFADQQARMMGARISNLRELPAAYIKYQLPRGREAGLFIVDDPDGRFDAGGRAVEIGPRHARIFNSRGYNTVVWRQDHTVYSLVSDSGEEDLIQLVRASSPAP